MIIKITKQDISEWHGILFGVYYKDGLHIKYRFYSTSIKWNLDDYRVILN